MPVSRRFCRECGSPRTQRNPISTNGLCQGCGLERMLRAAIQLKTRSGPIYDAWVESMERAAARARAIHDAQVNARLSA